MGDRAAILHILILTVELYHLLMNIGCAKIIKMIYPHESKI